MSTNHISVVIPCFNHADTLGRTLEALAQQTVLPHEVVVVDDASQDNPEPIVRSYERRLPISYLRDLHNHGAPHARNEGSRLMSGEYLLFLDADAELVPDALERYQNELDTHSEIDFVYADFFWGRKRFRGMSFDTGALKKQNYIHTSSLLRRAVFPGFDESLKKFQDWDLWLTMSERGSKGVWIDRPLFRVTPRMQGMSHSLPAFMHRMPWPIFGYTPKEIQKYRDAEAIIRKKHGI